jgi:NAD(P)H-dependent FMN reductase
VNFNSYGDLMIDPLKIAVVIGSTREGRFGPVVASWFVGEARRQTNLEVDLDVDVIDLAELMLPADYPRQPTPAVAAWTARLDAADAFVVVTPEYNHAYPAALKQAIDLARREWQAKPVAFVSYGGLSGGLRAVEQLRQVFAELHAVTIRDTVSFHMAHSAFDADGRPIDATGPSAAAKQLLDQLSWWARALRDARAIRPYAA